MSIAIRFESGTVIVSNEYSHEVRPDNVDGRLLEKQLIDVIAPFMLSGDKPNQGDECKVLTDERKVYKCSMYNKSYTDEKLRLHKKEEIEFNKQDWKTIK